MSRLARVVAVGIAHHITQRGVARQPIFTSDKSRSVYLALLREHAEHYRLRVLGYCLMNNHVHILAIPDHPSALASTFRYTHGRFAQYANAEQCRSGHFWQNRFYSCPVEDAVAANVLAYIELNPVRASLVNAAGDYTWSSATAHLATGRDSSGALDLTWFDQRWTRREWRRVLRLEQSDPAALRQATYTGRPLGSTEFVADLERRLDRRLERQKGGRPKLLQSATALPDQQFLLAHPAS